MRLSTLIVAAICVLLAAIRGTEAWGSKGHEAVASIAYQQLTPAVRQKVDNLLHSNGFSNIEDASTWPDRIKNKRPETSTLHYVNSNDKPAEAKCSFSYPANCGSHGDCVVSAIAHAAEVLGQGDAATENRGEALAFLTHFVGDLAQPLHASGYLRGSTQFKVVFNGRPMNLHGVWDSSLLEKSIKEDFAGSGPKWVSSIAAQIPAMYEKANLQAAANHDLDLECAMNAPLKGKNAVENCAAEWARMSNALVCESVYHMGALREGDEVSGDYYQRTKSLVRRQIMVGGMRLAAMLNSLLA